MGGSLGAPRVRRPTWYARVKRQGWRQWQQRVGMEVAQREQIGGWQKDEADGMAMAMAMPMQTGALEQNAWCIMVKSTEDAACGRD